jgi:hypothetical protein
VGDVASNFQQILNSLFAREDLMTFDGDPLEDNAAFSTMGAYYKTRMDLGSTRFKRYKDFRDMGEDTLISGALDLYADEATQYDRMEGATVWCDTHNPKVDEEIRRCLEKIGIEDYIWGIARNLAQYGDDFMRPLANKTKGVLNFEHFDPEHIERVVDRYTQLVGFRVSGFGDRIFDPWAFVHFRILGRTQSIERGGSLYGTSMLENARRTWRQLCLAKGTTIWTTAGPKNIEDVRAGDDVFCHDPDTGETAQTRVVAAKAMGRQKLVRVQTEHRELFVTPNHGLLAKTRSGEFVYKKAEDLIASNGEGGAAAQRADCLVLPSLATGTDCHVIELEPKDYYVHLKEPAQYDPNGIMLKLYRLGLSTSLKNAHGFLNAKRGIRLDDFCKLRAALFNGEHPDMVVTCGKSTRPTVASFGPANDRPFFVAGTDFVRLLGFMLGDGWVNEGGRVGFALGVDEKQNESYRQLFEDLFRTEMSTVQSRPGQGGQHYVGSIDIEKIFNAAGFVTGFANKVVPQWAFNLSPWLKVHMLRGIMDADGCENDGRITLANEKLARGIHTLCQQAGLRVSRKISHQDREDRQRSYRFWVEKIPLMDRWSPESVTYERVTHVEPAGEGETYDIQVDDDLHNFVANGVVSHNTLLEDTLIIYRLEIGGRHRIFYVDVGGLSHEQSLSTVRRYQRMFGKKEFFNPQTGEWTSRFNPLNLTADIFWPIRKDSQSRIEYLGTDPNVAAIVDIDYFRNKLFASLRVPKAYVGGEEYSSARFGLSQIDISFARLTKRLQRSVISGLTRLIQIHLAIRGLNPMDPNNAFTLQMASPSSLDQEQRMEAMEMALNLAMRMQQIGDVLPNINKDQLSAYIQKTILGLSPVDLGSAVKRGNVRLNPNDKGKITDAVLRHLQEDPELRAQVRQVRAHNGLWTPLIEDSTHRLFPEDARESSLGTLRDMMPESSHEEAQPFEMEISEGEFERLRPYLSGGARAYRGEGEKWYRSKKHDGPASEILVG